MPLEIRAVTDVEGWIAHVTGAADAAAPPLPKGPASRADLEFILGLGKRMAADATSTARRRTAPRHSERELAVVAGVPEPFTEVVASTWRPTHVDCRMPIRRFGTRPARWATSSATCNRPIPA
jgi:hypothetical protein